MPAAASAAPMRGGFGLERIPFERINALRWCPRGRGTRLELAGGKTGSPPSRGRTEWWHDSVQTRHALFIEVVPLLAGRLRGLLEHALRRGVELDEQIGDGLAVERT